MTRPTDDYEARKQLLVARSALCRLRLWHDAARVRESFTPARVGASVVRSPAARTAAFLLAVEIAGPDRIARLLSLASSALTFARIAGAAFAWLKDPPANPSEPPAP